MFERGTPDTVVGHAACTLALFTTAPECLIFPDGLRRQNVNSCQMRPVRAG